MGYEAGINIFLIEVKIFQKSFFIKDMQLINTMTYKMNIDVCQLFESNEYLILKHIVRQMYNLDLDVFYFTSRS